MESKETYALRVCGPMIVQSLDPMDVLDSLFSGKWLSIAEYQQVFRMCTSGNIRDACIKLLDLLRSRPSGAFECFVKALEAENSFLAPELRRLQQQAPEGRRREHSLSDLRETLIDGAVPDIPIQHVYRRKLVNNLATCLRTLAGRFRFKLSTDNATSEFLNLSLDVNVPNKGRGILPQFTDSQPEWQPPPTNSWLLVHGMAGCGKTALCASVLRRKLELLAECFPAGVIWLDVGSLKSPPHSPATAANAPFSLTTQLISLVDRLERKLSPSNRYSDELRQIQNTPPRSFSPPSVGPNISSSSTLDESLDRLRRALMRRQKRATWGPDEEEYSTSLLLIVLDDVWDVQVGRALSNMPAAFLVTSRDRSVLQHVETPVERFSLYEGLLEDEVAELLSNWTDLPVNRFSPPPVSTHIVQDPGHSSLYHLARQCHGSPFAVMLLGYLLREQYHRLSDYMYDPTGCGVPVLNWAMIRRPSAYGYETLFAAIDKSLVHLSPECQDFYRQLVIFDSNIVLTPKVAAILWDTTDDNAERILGEFVRFSLAIRLWVQYSDCFGYLIPSIQLDLLKISTNMIKQAAYHAQFFNNYEKYCSRRWWRLVSTGEHIYFWHQATEHVYKSGRLDKLVDLMTNLEFLRGRLAVVGASPIIAEFDRYRAVFFTLDRMDDWHAYLRFIQTNAYFVIDPNSSRPTMRGRSPYRKDTRSASQWSLESSSPVLQTDSVRGPYQAKKSETTATARPAASQAPKGLDLIQLGLGLPQNSPVFQQAVSWLLRQHQLADGKWTENGDATPTDISSSSFKQSHVSEYYWFWCNSHVAASQLLWAIPTGTQAVTCLAVECPVESDAETDSPTNQHAYRNRFLAATRDGRVLLLDAASGYEVAVQQTYSSDVEVKFVSFLSNNTECLTCGSNASLVVSTLPPPELVDRMHESDDGPRKYAEVSPNGNGSPVPEEADLMGGVDVDEDGDGSFYDALSTQRLSTNGAKDAATLGSEEEDDTSDVADEIDVSWLRRRSTLVTQFKVTAPIVLAEIPRLTEVVRVDSANQVPDGSLHSAGDSTALCSLQCICAPPSLDIVVMSCFGILDLTIHRADGARSGSRSQSISTLPSVYFLKRTENHLHMDCSRQLSLPTLPADCPMSRLRRDSTLHTIVAAVSADAQLIAIALQDGHIWVYSLEQISWIICISTHLALVHATDMEQNDSGMISVLDVRQKKTPNVEPEPFLRSGPTPSCCLFLPTLETPTPSTDSVTGNSLFAAALTNRVLVWSIPENIPMDESKLADPESLWTQSKPSHCFSTSSSAHVLCLDACLLAGQRVLAAGTTNGRVLFWRMRDGIRLFELSAHPSWVTSIRLLSPFMSPTYGELENGDLSTYGSNAPMGVLTASADGVIKRWDVGAACLPSPTTPSSVGPAWNSNLPYPTQSLQADPEAMSPTALHGLWTDVFSVWFGSHGALLVVGRRRHSADLQFLFRPQQHLTTGEVLSGRANVFQEITVKPSQPFYWRSSKESKARVSLPTSTRSLSTNTEEERSQKLSESRTSPPTSPARPTLMPTKHWIVTAGVTGTNFGRATAVSFWSCGLWVAVGYSNGLIQIFSLHYDKTHLFGIVKRYCLVESKPIREQHRSRPQTPKMLERVVQLHTWQSQADQGQWTTLVVVAVFASGAITFWHIPRTTHELSSCDNGCQDIVPSGSWPPMHGIDVAEVGPTRKLSQAEVYSRVVCDTDTTELPVPVTWSTLRRIPHLCTTDSQSKGPQQSPRRVRHILAWLTAGHDGMVYGRQVILPDQDSPGSAIPEEGKRPNRDFPPWCLNLEAHRSWTITDADVDPSGRWLVTSSTDKTAKVWSLTTGKSVFETAKHPACVRTVCFRPVIDAPVDSSDAEWFIATGDDAGALRIWCLKSHVLRDGYEDVDKRSVISRALSPDSYQITRRFEFKGAQKKLLQLNGNVQQNGSPTNLTRCPSPELNQTGPSMTPVSTRTVQKPPSFHSNAAGAGGTWLRRLVWSPDGRLLTGLSDRLCVWPFESSSAGDHDIQPIPTTSLSPSTRAGGRRGSAMFSVTHDIQPLPTTSLSPSTRAGGRRGSAMFSVNNDIQVSPATAMPQGSRAGGRRGSALLPAKQRILHRCRVLRVLSSGVSDAVSSSLSPLKVSPRRRCDFKDKASCTCARLPPSLSDLPPTLVTVDANTGTLYIFDPIGALFRSRLAV
ncbi:apoptotic protease-activating factor 1 [Clonorchis sinensis]|uniref:Apoptotic protease-activating factor 1 n=1 Tax=Clonorchis sinensis TaxID=79923 RepID=G7Y8U4_CLOSI|nr:apoptotic protease-activating factor 1 [Clonorchis sinensis]